VVTNDMNRFMITPPNLRNLGKYKRGHDRYWIGRLFASFEQIVVNNLAKK
jgi:hypothetical protein